MAANNKASFLRTNPGGDNVVIAPVLPGANGTWTKYTGSTTNLDQAAAAAGYIGFDYPDATGALAGYRIPFFTNS